MNIKELKEKIKISDLIKNENIKYLDRAQSIIINCLYHDDSNPSMSITDSIWKFNCFSCGESWDILNIMEKLYPKLGFKERMNYLENNLKKRKPADIIKVEESKELNIKKDSIYYKILDYICSYYQWNLNDIIVNKYLLWNTKFKDGWYWFNRLSIANFRIGYSINNKKLYNFLLKKIWKRVLNKYMVWNSLLWIFAKNWMPLFKNRIIFPILVNWKVESFIARKTEFTPLDRYSSWKYMFSSWWKKFLYSEDLLNWDYIFLTEGVTDCISLFEHWFNSVALMTTSITSIILDRLKEKLEWKVIYIIFDSDENKSWEKWAKKLSSKLNKLWIESIVIKIPLAKNKKKIDINEYFLNHSKKDFEKLLWEQIM